MPKKKPLSEQVVVVTGASSGLGRAIARGAGECGAKVVVTARNAEALDNCVAEIERFGSEGLAVPADCAEQEQVERVVARAVERFGRIDTYVANAIVTVYAEADRLEPDELRRVMDVGPEAGAAPWRLDPAPERLEEPAHRRAQAGRRSGQPISIPCLETPAPRAGSTTRHTALGLDAPPVVAPEGMRAAASMTSEWLCSN